MVLQQEPASGDTIVPARRSPHPLDPLLPSEIATAAKIVRDRFAGSYINFRAITLREPPKAEVLPYLQADRNGSTLPRTPDRIAYIQFYQDSPDLFRQIDVNLTTGEALNEKTLHGQHSFFDAADMRKAEKICLANPDLKKAFVDLQLPEDSTIVVDPWTYAPDGENSMDRRIIMVRDQPSS